METPQRHEFDWVNFDHLSTEVIRLFFGGQFGKFPKQPTHIIQLSGVNHCKIPARFTTESHQKSQSS